MSKTIKLEVITPEGIKFRGEAESLKVETVEGQIGILPDHCSYFALLAPGEMVIKYRAKVVKMVYGEGFIKFHSNYSTILAEFAQTPEEVEVERELHLKEEIQKKLIAFKYKSLKEQEALRRALKIASLRLKLAERE